MSKSERDDHPKEVQSSHDRNGDAPRRAPATEGDVGLDIPARQQPGPSAGEKAQLPGVSKEPSHPGEARHVAPASDDEDDLADPVEVILELVPEESREIVTHAISTIAMGSSYSGALPPAPMFNEYDERTQERMMRWNDAFTVDESRRQDRLVEAEIEQARKGPARSMTITILSMALAAVSVFVFENTVAAGIFLSAPILMYAGTLVRDLASRSSRGDDS